MAPRNYLTDPNIARRRRRSGNANKRKNDLSPTDRSAVLAGESSKLTHDSLDRLFHDRLLAAEARAEASVQRVYAARRAAIVDAGPGTMITEDVLTARGNSGNGCLNSKQIRQPLRGDSDDVSELPEHPIAYGAHGGSIRGSSSAR